MLDDQLVIVARRNFSISRGLGFSPTAEVNQTTAVGLKPDLLIEKLRPDPGLLNSAWGCVKSILKDTINHADADN